MFPSLYGGTMSIIQHLRERAAKKQCKKLKDFGYDDEGIKRVYKNVLKAYDDERLRKYKNKQVTRQEAEEYVKTVNTVMEEYCPELSPPKVY